jgi:serine/threonine protein kinase/dienelactone hydrolase
MDELASGTLLAGKYRINKVVGRGGMGIVYMAEDTQLKRYVALKFLPPELVLSPEARERFVQEARAAAALSHPKICTIYEIHEEGEKPFIAMEYIDGQSLKAKMAHGPLGLEEAIDIAVQVSEGLEEAHSKGITHRDIKSANIMITDKGQAKIMDFGLAKVKGGTLLTREGTTLGTVAYMSPEQALGKEVDQRTDLWSLAVVLCEMLTGELPFKGEREVSILYSIVHEEPKPLKDIKPPVPIELRRVIEKAMMKNADSRYLTAAAMLRDLRGYRDTLKMESAGVFSPRSLLKRIRRPIVLIPSLVVLIVIALGVTWFLNRQAKITSIRAELLPKIESLIEAGRGSYIEAYNLAIKAEKYVPHDPKLAEFFSKITVSMSIETEPSGAKIFQKEYAAPESEWKYLGVSPSEKRLPVGFFKWKLEKEGFETVYAASSTFDVDLANPKGVVPFHLARVLDKQGTVPPGMVRVKGERIDGVGEISDFYIDQYEVTNKQFKEFIDEGGYQKKEYWKQTFIREGKELAWEDGIKEFVDQTGRPGPSTWVGGDHPEGQEDYPVSGVSWYEAAAYAQFAGKSLPTIHHWQMAAVGGIASILRTWGFYSLLAPTSNFMGKGAAPIARYPGITPYGAYDMAGNVREWCWNEATQGRVIRGGAWNDVPYMFLYLSQALPLDRSPRNGFRCVLCPNPDKIPKPAFEAVKVSELPDFYKMTPVPNSVFQIYKERFFYDRTNLNSSVEWKNENSKDWIQEKISLNAAYENERIIAYLFLPKNGSPPYQTVIYFPGSGSLAQQSSKDLDGYWEFVDRLSLIVKNGRAVLYPVYKGFFERRDDDSRSAGANSHLYAEWLIKVVKDFKRCTDYLETRPDIDSSRIAYCGFSLGAQFGPIILALEDRVRAAILVDGGLVGIFRPEVNDINYVTRVKTPVLMLNGRFDMTFPYEPSVKPLYDLLGTPKQDKLLKLYETDHYIPLNELIKEILTWLDKYLGPVKK